MSVVRLFQLNTLCIVPGTTDLTATILTEVFNDVCIEPELQSVTDEESTANSQVGASLAIAANGVWGGIYLRENLL